MILFHLIRFVTAFLNTFPSEGKADIPHRFDVFSLQPYKLPLSGEFDRDVEDAVPSGLKIK